MGARFARWRAVISPAGALPIRACIEVNARALARLAALSHEPGLVPIVAPEVLMASDHTLQRCQEASGATLHCVSDQLYVQGVVPEAMILKPDMVLPGLESTTQDWTRTVVAATVASLLRVVPATVAEIASCPAGNPVNWRLHVLAQ